MTPGYTVIRIPRPADEVSQYLILARVRKVAFLHIRILRQVVKGCEGTSFSMIRTHRAAERSTFLKSLTFGIKMPFQKFSTI
jgi:hypothetical protein